jgi:Putative endonuclease segE, GIY-YIG domain
MWTRPKENYKISGYFRGSRARGYAAMYEGFDHCSTPLIRRKNQQSAILFNLLHNTTKQTMTYGHWDTSQVGDFNTENFAGFVYEIENLQTNKKYIGCKAFYYSGYGSKWENYTGGSVELNKDIQDGGPFSFKILSLHKTRHEYERAEAETQLARNALEDRYYNKMITHFYKVLPKVLPKLSYREKCAIAKASSEKASNRIRVTCLGCKKETNVATLKNHHRACG